MIDKKPNILIIWGDDVGMYNISAYHRGLMGGSTPNIDRIANEGMLFVDHYAQASCTAGRAAFITGQYPIRVGLATVGLPGSPLGLSKEDPTIAELLKPLGYATGQFGKNHLGDRDEHLPTAHGFDEFFGISTISTRANTRNNTTFLKIPRRSRSSALGSVASYTHGPTRTARRKLKTRVRLEENVSGRSTKKFSSSRSASSEMLPLATRRSSSGTIPRGCTIVRTFLKSMKAKAVSVFTPTV